MTAQQAQQTEQGTRVTYQGRRYTVASIRVGRLAGPHFRLSPAGDYPGEDLTSYRIVGYGWPDERQPVAPTATDN